MKAKVEQLSKSKEEDKVAQAQLREQNLKNKIEGIEIAIK